MKVIEKIKKGLIGIGVFLLLLPSKVFSISDSMLRISPTPMYGVQQPEPVRSNLVNNIWNICKMFVIPIALLIGIIVYLKKSKSNTKRKFIMILITLAIVAVLYFTINYIVDNVI